MSRQRDRRPWRLSLCTLMLLLAACSSTPDPQPAHQPLEDRTQDTDYRLETVSAKLRSAEEFEVEGQRGLAVAVVEAAQQMLPQDHMREREYLEVVKATIWAREGEGRDASQAQSLLQPVEDSAKLRKDTRMLADIELARVVLLLAQGDKVGAARAGDAALRAFSAAQAHARGVEAARDLAFQFLQAGNQAEARSFARQAHADATRIDDEVLLIQTCMDAGRIEAETGGDAGKFFLQAYESAYRIDSLGWRNVVIAVAADTGYSRGSLDACVRWGDRLRTRDGHFPALPDTGLYVADYITLLAQYHFACVGLDRASRGSEAAVMALDAIESLPETEQTEWQELAEKLRAGLLQPEGEK